MALNAFWRRARERLEADARPEVELSPGGWIGHVATVGAIVMVIVGLWWWGFDFGELLGGSNRKELEARATMAEVEAARLRGEAGELRMLSSRLESDLTMSRGAEQALSRQASDLVMENAQLKEEVAFLQKLVSESSKQPGLTIPRLAVEAESDGAYRYNLLVVRGGNPKGDFEGNVVLEAIVTPPEGGTRTVTLPDDQPDSRLPLDLRFKYYQRVEGTLKLPAGSRLVALTARAFEDGSTNPRAARTLNQP